MTSLPSTMKALRAARPPASPSPVLAVEDIPVPCPGPNDLLLKIRASAIQPADLLNSQGGFPTTTFPRTLGKDFAGTVVSGPNDLIGKNVFGTSGGTLSFTADGAQAEYAVVPSGAVAVMPTGMSFVQAGALGTPWGTAAVALDSAQAREGESVMVLGAGGAVGGAVVQIARAKGCRAIGVGRHGADVDSVADPTLQAARELTGGMGPDVVVDTVGELALTRAAFDVLADRGRMVVITAPRSGSTELRLDLKSLYRRQIKVVGVNTAAVSQEAMGEVLRGLMEGFATGALVAPGEDGVKKVGIEEAVEAYEGKIRKAVVVFADK